MEVSVFRFPIFILLFLTSVQVHAQMMRGTMQGVIAESAETRGEGDTVFGLNGNDLLGQSFWINFYYRTDIAPVSSDTSSASGDRRTYQSTQDDNDWLGMSLTVNELTYNLPATFRFADVFDRQGRALADTDRLQLAVSDQIMSVDGTIFRRQFLDVSVSLNNVLLNSTDLPSELNSSNIRRVFNSATFRINEFDRDPVTGALLYERYVGFNLHIQTIQVTAVPVPAAIWLFSCGLALLLSVGRIRLGEDNRS